MLDGIMVLHRGSRSLVLTPVCSETQQSYSESTMFEHNHPSQNSIHRKLLGTGFLVRIKHRASEFIRRIQGSGMAKLAAIPSLVTVNPKHKECEQEAGG